MNKLSHNIYSEDTSDTSKKLPNYLIVLQKETNFKDLPYSEIIRANCLTDAINLVRNKQCVCTIYESVSSKGTSAKYLCDCSYGVI